MSGLALLLHARGYTVSGCTMQQTRATDQLVERGIKIVKKHDAAHITTADVIVYTPDTSGAHPELQAARKANKPTITRGQLLAELIAHQYSIAVTGVHGKNTLTALVGHLLASARQHPTIVTNSIMRNVNAAVLCGNGDWAVVEVNSANRELDSLRPTIGVITNIDDEPDSFVHFLERLPFYGTAILCADEKKTYNLQRVWHGTTITYGLSAHAHIRGHIVSLHNDHTIINVSHNSKLLGTLRIPLAGNHNVVHVLGALAVCYGVLGMPFNKIQTALLKFRGLARHFEHIGNYNNAAIIDDNADDATSLDALLLTCRQRTHTRLHLVLQLPNLQAAQYQEQITHILLKHASHLFALHIVPPDTQDAQTSTSGRLLTALHEQHASFALYCYNHAEEVADTLALCLSSGDVVLTMGSGQVCEVGQRLLSTV